ncbi:MAG TPA: hypothetical protein VKZ63_21205 [Kofleriaceae bacterium]|nr:hypothetical protein [Kofleriaceae bacterium]
MRVLRCAWPLAGVLFVSLAGAEIVRADEPRSGGEAEGELQAPAPISIRIFGRTWCLGQPVDTTCDILLPLGEPAATPAFTAPSAAVTPDAKVESGSQGGSLQQLLDRVKRLFGGDQPTAPGAAAPPASG